MRSIKKPPKSAMLGIRSPRRAVLSRRRPARQWESEGPFPQLRAFREEDFLLSRPILQKFSITRYSGLRRLRVLLASLRWTYSKNWATAGHSCENANAASCTARHVSDSTSANAASGGRCWKNCFACESSAFTLRKASPFMKI